jgi:hypothetical protein
VIVIVALSIHSETLPICFLKRGTSQNRVLACAKTAIDQLTQTLQPRPPILIGQRNALPHFLNVRLRVEIVALKNRQPSSSASN